jgi:hypothetical protein
MISVVILSVGYFALSKALLKLPSELNSVHHPHGRHPLKRSDVPFKKKPPRSSPSSEANSRSAGKEITPPFTSQYPTTESYPEPA